MSRKNYRLFLIILIIAIICSVFLFTQLAVFHDQSGSGNATATSQVTRELIGNDSLGTVEVIKNVGNPNGKKIAYVVGVHPLENDTHTTLLNQLPKQSNLNYCYDIYVINVSMNYSQYGQLLPDDQPGREEGQNLALKYVYPQIVNGSYELAVDIHGHGSAYPYDTFVFSPVDGGTGEAYGRNVSQSTQNISYYNPYQTTSGPYLTIPLNENGVPAFYLEENSYFSQDVKDMHMRELIKGVDGLKFS